MMTFFSAPSSPEPEVNLFGFEGPEKRLEVTFTHSIKKPNGLRSIRQDEWQDMLDYAKCTIISSTSNDFLDSYVLSESSLFVYPSKIILKTCGTTTLLNCLDKLEQLADSVGAEFLSVVFSRKNFNFPERQLFPHHNFEMEIAQLEKKFMGHGYILGPVHSGGDHHFVYFSPMLPSDSEGVNFAPSKSSSTLEILMSELSPDTMENFYRTQYFIDAKTTTRNVGLAHILPCMITDEVMFTPCGYSVNGISNADGSYFTVHVTPEAHCSFVSFETNADLCPIKRQHLIEEVVKIFRPGRFSVVLTSDSDCPVAGKTNVDGFITKFRNQAQYEEGFHVHMTNYLKTPTKKYS